MTFEFKNPLILLILPIVAVFVLTLYRGMQITPLWKRRTILTLRLVTLILLVFCLSGLGIKIATKKINCIFLADVSDSCSRNKANFEQLVQNAEEAKGVSDNVGIICFGKNAEVEQPPVQKPYFSHFRAKVDGSLTDIEQALKLAASLIPSDGRKKVVLLSDGNENTGNALKQARILKQQNISLDVLPFSQVEAKEVQLKEINLPESMNLGQSFEVTVNVRSTLNTSGTLKLYANRTLVSEKNIDIRTGDNYYAISDKAKIGGLVTYSAEVEPISDKIVKNNKLSAFSFIDDVPKLLVIQDSDVQGSELVKILDGLAEIKVIRPENAPTTVAELQKYNAYILCNISAEKLDDRFLASLDTCIRYQGRGLLVTGGDSSYAPGGYYKTVLEKVLPVNMSVQPRKEDPNLGLMLVIDKSGSMSQIQNGITKIDLAKEAAIRATEVLKKNDRIGIIAFDSTVQWVLMMQNPSDLKKIQNLIGTIRADGETQLYNPLDEAYRALVEQDTKLKHIILLTDGEAEKKGYEDLISNLNAAKITLSTVAVGEEADRALLAAMAKSGRGRYYSTNDFSDIPKIFAKETIFAENKYLTYRSFTPRVASNSAIIKDMNSLPALGGYVATTAKSAAKVILESDIREPVLATWQYGLGRTVAWTPDAAGMWTQSFMKWDKAPTFWRNIVSYIIGEKAEHDFSLKTSTEQGKQSLELTLPSGSADLGEKAEAVLISPAGKEQTVELKPASPCIYKGSVKGDETGAYTVNINIIKNSNVVKSIKTAIIMPYSSEYNIPDENIPAFLGRLANEGGGNVLVNPDDVFKNRQPLVTSMTDMTQTFLILILMLLLLETASRRLNVDFRKLPFAGYVKAVFTIKPSKKSGTGINSSVLPEKKKTRGM